MKNYFLFKSQLWSPQTLKSETARLRTVLNLHPQSPADLFTKLSEKGLKAYSIKQAFIRYIDFLAFESAPLKEYKDFIKTNKRFFSAAYKLKHNNFSYKEIENKLNSIKNIKIREYCFALLEGGLRYHEAATFKNGVVIGKGNKERRVFNLNQISPLSYFIVYRFLKKLNLTPHMLRKARATYLAQNGFDVYTLCKIFGWENINTSQKYVKALEDKYIEEKLLAL